MKFQTKTIALFNECCLADVYIEAALRYNSKKITDGEKAKILLDAVDRGYLLSDGFVKDPVGLMKLAVPGTSWTIEKKPLNKCRGSYAAVRYTRNGLGHWTLFGTSTGMLYNGLDYSNCVANGSPVFEDVRDIIQL